jgi:uncharacterized protein YbjT (DUF2867 family)
MKTVLIAGASGYCGSHLFEELRNRGYRIHVLVRSEQQAGQFRKHAGKVTIGEVTRPESLNGVMDGVDTVVSAIGITTQKEGFTYDEVDFQGNLNLLREAENAGVQHFTYVASYRGVELRHLKMVDAKERFVEALKASDLQHTIIQPNGFFVDLYAVLQFADNGVVPLIDGGSSRINYISGTDLARFIADAMEEGKSAAEVGGPEPYSHREVAEMAFEALGLEPRFLHFSREEVETAVNVLRSFTSETDYGLLEFMLESMSRESIAPLYGQDRVADFLEKASAPAKTKEPREVTA